VRENFEATYAPSGAWGELFARAEHYLGTELLRGPNDSYLTVNSWRSKADFTDFLTTVASIMRRWTEAVRADNGGGETGDLGGACTMSRGGARGTRL
jgi:heme-degrading monooxygenase HmoA